MKYLRRKEGISQDDLAAKSGISQSQIAKLESKIYSHSPTIRTLARLSKALNICPYRLAEYFVTKRSDITKCSNFNIVKRNKF
mgnify:CR=1 FL=1